MAKKQKSSSNLLEVQNAAKTMFANIRFQSIDKPIKTIVLTSTVPDEGKTTTAWYLAQAAATAGNRVLMVEGDMRRRSLANMLQLHPQNGLFAVLTGNAQLENAVVPTSVKNLYFLDAEPSIPNPPDLLASKRMQRFNENLAKEYDYVIYDTPPVGTFVDAAVLGTVADGVILIVRPGRPKRTELQLAHSQLVNAGANIIGICTTFVEGTGSEYYYSYYTKGDRSKRGDGKDISMVVDSTAGASHIDSSFAEPARPAAKPTANQAAKPAAGQADSMAPISNDTPWGWGDDRTIPKKQAASHAAGASAFESQVDGRSGRQISIPRGTPNHQGNAGASGNSKASVPNRTARIWRK